MSEALTPGWRAAERNAALVVELPGGGGPMHFQQIPAGRFRMGSRAELTREEPAHDIELTQPFCLGTFPVTQRQFDAWVRATGRNHSHHHSGSPLLPAERVDWHDAQAFCAWLGEAGGLPAGVLASLPTEAEWEYACRGGTTTEYWSGDGEAALAEVGWYDANSGGRIHAVGELLANPWGLHDMHGNVWEWCLDSWDESAYRFAADGERHEPHAARSLLELEDSRADRVLRGGSWGYSAWGCRSAFRLGWRPGDRLGFLGFRVCLLPGPVVQPACSAEASAGGASDGTERREPKRAGARPAAISDRPTTRPDSRPSP